MKQIDLIYKEKILDKIRKDSMLQILVAEIEPFIKEAMKESAWRMYRSVSPILLNHEDFRTVGTKAEQREFFEENYNVLLNFRSDE